MKPLLFEDYQDMCNRNACVSENRDCNVCYAEYCKNHNWKVKKNV